MSISVTLSDVTAAAKQQLSIIGKHHKTASGETLFSTESSSLTFVIDNTRWNNGLDSAFSAALLSYLIASTVQSVINMFAPDIAPKYTADAQHLLASLVKMAFTKQQPRTSSSAYNISATATVEDSEKNDGYSN